MKRVGIWLLLLTHSCVLKVCDAVETRTNVTKSTAGDDWLECANGRKIEKSKKCDGIDNCNDGFMTDECDCENVTEAVRSYCEKWQLLRYLYPGRRSDSFGGCGQDHDIYECIVHDNLVNCSLHPDTIRCDTPGVCATRALFCDDKGCCPDVADKRHFGFGLKCSVIGAGHSDKCLLPDVHLNDDVNHCMGGQENCYVLDENGTRTGILREGCFQCMNKEHIILAEQVCDGILDCSDFSDECLCKDVVTPQVCKLIYEEDVDVEKECKFGKGDVSCGDGNCISKSLVCDGRNDCADSTDEKYCHSEKYKRQLDETALKKEEIYCNVTELDEDELELKEAVMCDGIPECDDMEDECGFKCQVQGQRLPDFCSANLHCVPPYLVCNGVRDSQKLKACGFTYVPAEEENCPGRFYCDDDVEGVMSVEESQVCDGVANCFDGSDESQERHCSGRFYCETNGIAPFMATDHVRTSRIFIPQYQVDDGRYDCDDGSDECPQDGGKAMVFNSKTEMIGLAPLRVIVWINAVVAFFGNLLVIVYSFVSMRCHLQSQIVAKCHHMLVLFLSLADFLMGIYLLAIAIKNVMFSGRYCPEHRAWRASTTCTVLGVISFVSSELSVIIMLIMAIFRFVTVHYPLLAFNSKNWLRKTRLILISSLVFVCVCAAIPLMSPLKAHFITHAWVNNPVFFNYPVSSQDLVLVATKIFVSSVRGHGLNVTVKPTTVFEAEEILAQAFPQSKIVGWVGFYGKVSVCLPGIFSTIDENGWQFSMAIIIFNMAAFSLMVIFYGMIVYSTKTSSKTLNSSPIPDSRLRERVTRLLFTDFLCWVPICVTSFIYLAGIDLGSIPFAVSGIVLLPINSALNPILYSELFEMFSAQIRNGFKRSTQQRQSTATASSPEMTRTVRSRILGVLHAVFNPE